VSEFTYNAESDSFRCPAGQALTRRGYNKNEKGWYYRADTEICAGCPLCSQCTTTAHPSHTRLIVRPEGHKLLLHGWAQAASAVARRDRRRRMTLVEGRFGQASQIHHLKRARYRRLWRQAIQDHLIAAVQNVKKILQHGPLHGNSQVSPKESRFIDSSKGLSEVCEIVPVKGAVAQIEQFVCGAVIRWA